MPLTKSIHHEFSRGQGEKERLHEFLCDNRRASSETQHLEVLKTCKIGLLTNITIKWKGNNRKICTILFIILQVLLTLTLLGKIGIVKMNKTQMRRNFTEVVLSSKSIPLDLVGESNTEVTQVSIYYIVSIKFALTKLHSKINCHTSLKLIKTAATAA